MPNSQSPDVLQPGVDAASHVKPLHQAVATSLSQVVGRNVAPRQVIPPAQQSPASGVDQKPGFELDLEDIISREQGKGGNEKSKTFFTRLKERIKRKFPSQEVKAE